MNVAQLPTANDRCLHSRFGPARIRRQRLGEISWTVVLLGSPHARGRGLRVALELRELGCPLESMLESSPSALERRLSELGRAGGGLLIFAADAELASEDAGHALCELMEGLAQELHQLEEGHAPVEWRILPGSSLLHVDKLRAWSQRRGLSLDCSEALDAEAAAKSGVCPSASPGKSARPWVTSSHAQTLDGTIAGTSRAPLLLSGDPSMAFAHHLRVEHDAVLVGVNTVISDNPRLTARLAEGKDPRPVVLDSRLRTPGEAELFRHPCAPLIFCTQDASLAAQRALESRGALVHRLPADAHGQVELRAVLHTLVELGIDRLLVEGGATILSRFLAAGVVDEVVMTLAPRLSSGLRATNELLGFDVPLSITSVSHMGEDLVLRAKPLARSAAPQHRVFAERL